MATSIFDCVAVSLEARTDLQTLEARGTLRLALKAAGLDARGVSAPQMQVVLSQVLPAELRARGVAQAETVCAAVAADLAASPVASGAADDPEAPEAVFRRLARR